MDNTCNIILLTILAISGTLVWPHWSAIPYFVIGGLCANLFGRLTLVPVINYLGAARAGVLGLSSPIASLVLGMLLLGERPNLIVFSGLILILMGLFFIAFEQKGEQDAKNKDLKGFVPVHFKEKGMPKKWVNSVYFYVFLGMLSGVLYGVSSYIRKLGLNISSTIIPSVAIGSFSSLIVALVYVLITDKDISFRKIPDVLKNKDYVFAGLLTACAQYSFFAALSMTMVSIANMIKSTSPLFTITLSRVLLQDLEAISKKVFLFCFIIVLGAVLIAIG